MRTWDTQGSSRRALALLVVVVVSGVLLLPAGWHPLRPASAQTSDNPPPDEPKDGEVSEFLEAAKLGALASGNVIAGPGQVVIPAGSEDAATLWEHAQGALPERNQAAMDVTLTVQGLGGCPIQFRVLHRTSAGGTDSWGMQVGRHHESQALSVPGAFKIEYELFGGTSSDCLFLWVLRETSDSDPRGR